MIKRSFGWMLLAVLVAATSWAQEKAADDLRVTAIAPYLSDATSIVVHLNLRNLDLKTATDRIVALIPDADPDNVIKAKAGIKVVDFARSSLMEAGASDLYVVGDGADSEKAMGFLVVPVETGKDPADVIAALKALPSVDQEPFTHKGNVILGDVGTKEYVEGIVATDPSRFHNAFRYCGQTDLQVVIAPGKNLKENVPAEAAAAEDWIKDTKGLAVTANLPPKPALAIYALLKDEATATKGNEAIKEALTAEQVQQATQAFPVLTKVIDLFSPKQDGAVLKVVLTESNGGIAKLQAVIKEAVPVLKEQFGGMLGGPPGAAPADPNALPGQGANVEGADGEVAKLQKSLLGTWTAKNPDGTSLFVTIAANGKIPQFGVEAQGKVLAVPTTYKLSVTATEKTITIAIPLQNKNQTWKIISVTEDSLEVEAGAGMKVTLSRKK